jgi:hypothetical protein
MLVGVDTHQFYFALAMMTQWHKRYKRSTTYNESFVFTHNYWCPWVLNIRLPLLYVGVRPLGPVLKQS